MLRTSLSVFPFSTVSSVRFPRLLFRFPVLGFLFVPFRPSLIRSHSCLSGASLLLSPSGLSASPPVPFVPLFSASGYSVFCFFLSVLPVSASQWLPRCRLSAFASLLSPFFPARFPVPSFPVFVLGFLLVSFRPSRLRFPQLFHRCLPLAHAFGIRPSFSAFFRPLLFRI